MGQPVVLNVNGAVAADADGISLSQTPLAAGNLTITGAYASGGVATIAAAGNERPVVITTNADETSKTFTAYGTNASGNPIQSSVLGVSSSTVEFPLLYRTVTRIAVSAATAGAVTVGTTAVNYSRPAILNIHAQPVNISYYATVVGTVSYTLQHTLNDPNGELGMAGVTWFPDATMATKAAAFGAVYNDPIFASRLNLISGTGSVQLTIIQAGITGN